MKKVITAIFISALLASCGTVTPVFKAAGQYDQKKYVFELEDQLEGMTLTTILRANGKEVFNHTWKNLYKEPACQKTAVASWKCVFTADLDGQTLKIVKDDKAELFSNSKMYELYINDEFITQINASINT